MFFFSDESWRRHSHRLVYCFHSLTFHFLLISIRTTEVFDKKKPSIYNRMEASDCESGFSKLHMRMEVYGYICIYTPLTVHFRHETILHNLRSPMHIKIKKKREYMLG